MTLRRHPPALPVSSRVIDAAPAALHPRNRHPGRYDFARLAQHYPPLSAFLTTIVTGEASIDFGNPDAVRALNRALLKTDYGIAHWDIPDGYLCPPVPGRADYLHGLADLLAEGNGGVVPRGAAVIGLDIGVGANCIYPLLGHADYGWRFVGCDIDPAALAAAAVIVAANPGLNDAIKLRHQPARGSIFAGVLQPGERFDFSLCNPPFHGSAQDAARGSRRKWRNLGKPDASKPGADMPPSGRKHAPPSLNFGGQSSELWCTGGEASFVRRMIRESAGVGTQVLWFSTLLAKAEHLADVHKQLKKVGALAVLEVPMAQGHKQSRFVAWTFLDQAQRAAWRAARWGDAG